MEQQPKRQHARSVERAVNRTDALMTRLAHEVGSAVAELGDRTLTHGDMPGLMRKIDTALNKVYGSTNRTHTPLADLIAQETARTRRRVISSAIAPIERDLREFDPDTLRRIERRVKRREL